MKRNFFIAILVIAALLLTSCAAKEGPAPLADDTLSPTTYRSVKPLTTEFSTPEPLVDYRYTFETSVFDEDADQSCSDIYGALEPGYYGVTYTDAPMDEHIKQTLLDFITDITDVYIIKQPVSLDKYYDLSTRYAQENMFLIESYCYFMGYLYSQEPTSYENDIVFVAAEKTEDGVLRVDMRVITDITNSDGSVSGQGFNHRAFVDVSSGKVIKYWINCVLEMPYLQKAIRQLLTPDELLAAQQDGSFKQYIKNAVDTGTRLIEPVAE